MNRFKRDILVAAICFSVILAGCSYFTPVAKQSRADAKVTLYKEKIKDSRDSIIDESKGYVFAADYALKLNPETNNYTTIAKQMTTRALTGLGQPDMADMVKMTAIVEGLVSTNKAIVSQAKSMLEAKDATIAALQGKISSYELTLKEKEVKLSEVNRENASLANTWVSIKRFFWYGIYLVIAFFIFRILSVVLPPPYNSVFGIFDYIIGGFIRGVFKLVPKAMDTAKVVGADVQVALNHVVESIEETKTKVKAKNEVTGEKSVGLEQLKMELNTVTDSTSKNIISDTKKSLGYV